MYFFINLDIDNPGFIISISELEILSTTIAPPPPVVVAIPTLLPFAITLFLNKFGISIKVSKISTLLIPLCLVNALNASSEPAIAPVWDKANSLPRSDFPNLYVMTFLPAEWAKCAISETSLLLRKVSKNKIIVSVLISSTNILPISPTERSDSFPTEINFEKPMPREEPCAKRAPIKLPLWDTTLKPPFLRFGNSRIAFALKITESDIFIIPILLGPNILKFPVFAMSKILFSNSVPSGPYSLPPPDKIVAHFTSSETASLMASTILSPSRAINTWSIFS